MLLHEKFLQSDWLRAVVFQLNLKYLVVSGAPGSINKQWLDLYVIFGINTTRDISKLSRNITRGIYAKYHYKSCYYLYKSHNFRNFIFMTSSLNNTLTKHPFLQRILNIGLSSLPKCAEFFHRF